MYRFNDAEHVHLLNDKPLIGTSTVSNVLAKPLTYWAAGLAVEKFGWLNPRKFSVEECEKALTDGYNKVMGMSKELYKKLLNEAYTAHATKLKSSAKDGTDLHAELERFVKNQMQGITDAIYPAKIQPFIDWSKTHVKRFIWSEVNCYSEKHWVGGISDVGIEDMDGKIAIIDFKSSKEAYASQFFQCAGYAIQLEENGGFTATGERVLDPIPKVDYVAIVPFGASVVAPAMYYDMEAAKEAFLAEVTLYKRLLPFNN